MLTRIFALIFCCLIGAVHVDGKISNFEETPNLQACHAIKKEKNPYAIPLAIAMIFQNEAAYLKEWIEYHKMLGVTRFYLYNNKSTDNYKQVLAPYIKTGIVKLIEWDGKRYDGHDLPSWNAVQCLSYMNALTKARKDHVKWLAILDSDEFMVPRNTDSLIDFLNSYENTSIGCLHINWVFFGTSYVKKIPSKNLLVETLLLNNGYVLCGSKTIVRPDRCNRHIMRGPHNQPLLPNYEELQIPFDELQLNHYWSRDEYYLNNIKIPRRILWGTPQETCLEWANSYNQETEASEPILRFIPKLRKAMGF